MRVQDFFVSSLSFYFIFAVHERANFVPAICIFVYLFQRGTCDMYVYIIYIYKPDTHFYIDRFAFALTFLLQVVPFLTYTFCSAQKMLN